MNEIKKIDAQVATMMMECDRMESAVRALNEEKPRKDNGLKSVESELAQRKMKLVGWNLISALDEDKLRKINEVKSIDGEFTQRKLEMKLSGTVQRRN